MGFSIEINAVVAIICYYEVMIINEILLQLMKPRRLCTADLFTIAFENAFDASFIIKEKQQMNKQLFKFRNG